MKHLEQYVALKGHSVSAGCLSWFIWFSQNISTECLLRTEWHIESPHPEDGLLESSYAFKEFFLFCSRGIWNSKTTPLSRNVTQMAALESKPCLSALEIWARWQAQKLTVLVCVLVSGKSEAWSALPAPGTGACARASTPACTRSIPVKASPAPAPMADSSPNSFRSKAFSQNRVDSGFWNDSS